MDWIQSLSKAIHYIENHLTDSISIDDVSHQTYTSSSHFQFIFHVVTGITIGEYIRNRRLSLAAQDLLQADSKLIDVAMRYQYDTQESFSKAFKRFHGMPPSKIRKGQARQFHPLTINITILGGFDMSGKFTDEFHLLDWSDIDGEKGDKLTNEEKYQRIVDWSRKARWRNPNVFDALTEWVLDDSEWNGDKLAENEQILMHGVFARFREQNARLRAYLKKLNGQNIVNAPVFKALDWFDEELSGHVHQEHLQDVVARVFADFSIMRERGIRKVIAGNKTGPTGTDSVEIYGYINSLKDCDAGVQWALFMPGLVKRQQTGFQVENFTYTTMPDMRFIGREGDEFNNIEARRELFQTLDAMKEYRSDFGYDLFFMHHYGMGVDVGPWHGVWGRFMKKDTPVPQGFLHFDFIQEEDDKAGLPYCTQFAMATFSGDRDAMHRREGYDSDAMYDVTRNIILGQGVMIPYPDKYWTAEVFLDGHDKPGSAYLFSVKL